MRRRRWRTKDEEEGDERKLISLAQASVADSSCLSDAETVRREREVVGCRGLMTHN